MNTKILLVLANFIVFNLGLFVLMSKPEHHALPVSPQIVDVIPNPPIVESPPINYEIEKPIPSYLNYQQTVAQLKKWNEEAPELTDVGTYGKSSDGTDIYYIRVHNKRLDADNPKVLITACIHGNEPWSASVVMGYIGTILDKYGDDQQITDLVDSRDIYFVPVVSPDSYPNSRYVDGVDPNRDFPTLRSPEKRSVPPIQALREFFLKIEPDAVISGHTWGRVYLTPWGDQTRLCPNDSDYQRIIGKMAELSQYRMQRACQMYNRPIYGTEVDWYYRNGAFSIVMEFGTHQRVPSMSDIQTEFDRTFKAVLHFIEEAPEVRINFFVDDSWREAA